MTRTRAHGLLEQCIADTPGGPVEVAYKIGCSVSSLHYVRQGSVPRKDRRKAFAKWSKGRIPVDSWEQEESASPRNPSAPPHRAA